MNKLILIILSSLISVSYAKNFDDWTNEDLCRWLDSVSIPEQILDEIDARKAKCYVSYEATGLKAQIPYENENLTVLPIASSQTIRKVKPNTILPIRFKFNFKFTL